jgi:tetratricopeptide (TPR) repeat protein
MNRILLFSLVLVAMILGSCGSQMDYAELQTSGTERLRLQAAEFFKNKEYDKAIDAYEILLTKTESPKSVDYFNLGRCYYVNNALEKADSVFTLLIERHPAMNAGYLWRARARSRIDSMYAEFPAKSDYEKLIELRAGEPGRYGKELIEAYLYMGFYYFSESEFEKSRNCYNQVVKLDPDPKSAQICKEALKALDNLKK